MSAPSKKEQIRTRLTDYLQQSHASTPLSKIEIARICGVSRPTVDIHWEHIKSILGDLAEPAVKVAGTNEELNERCEHCESMQQMVNELMAQHAALIDLLRAQSIDPKMLRRVL